MGFTSIITALGAEKIALAALTGEKVTITYMAVGDGGGKLPIPEKAQTALINELYRAELNSIRIDENALNTIVAEMTVPAQVGGFWVREVGLYSDDGQLIAVGNLPETYKPLMAEGSGRVQTVRMVIAVSSTSTIDMKIDPSVVVATIEYVDREILKVQNRIEDAYALANTRTTFDEIYPPGVAIFFAVNLNPNEHWPGTQWYYTGENKTIRIGKEDGSDVMTTGGADTATLTVDNMPKHTHNASGSVGEFDHGTKGSSSFDYGTKGTSDFNHGTKGTSESGDHAHQGGMRGPGDEYSSTISGTDSDGRHSLNWTSNNGNHSHSVNIGAHSHTVSIGAHSHSVNIGSHTHSLELAIAEAGGGESFSIVESHIKLMCWYRAA